MFHLFGIADYTSVSRVCDLLFSLSSYSPSESQNLNVRLTLHPLSGIGVLFALVHQDRVPLSIALADYHPGTEEWRDVSTRTLNWFVCVFCF